MKMFSLSRSDIPDILKSAFRREDGDSMLEDYEDDFEDDDEDESVEAGDLAEAKFSIDEMWETFRLNPTVRRYDGECT
jgi:hypothetical protein